MPAIEYQGVKHALEPGESVLDALLRQGIAVPHSCKQGTCRSCLMRAVSGAIPARSQSSLKETWKALGYFLPCVCVPEEDIELASAGADVRSGASIASLELLSPDVMRVGICPDIPFDFQPGQYITLLRGDGFARSYSIASLPESRDLELHVRRIPGGRMSGWLHDEARVGDRLSVMGPSGECFYVPGRATQPVLLIGTGTGLAPLLGILRDALRQGHTGPIHLLHGALNRSGLYLVGQLRDLAAAYNQFEYTPAILNGEAEDGFAVGPLDQVLFRKFPKLTGWRAYICGDPAIVRLFRKKIFLAGAASNDIFADAFLPAAQ